MKRFLRGFIFAFIAILSFTLMSCGTVQTPHEHTPSAAWKRDSSGHWHECEGCDDLVDFSLHTLSDWTKLDGECKEKRECSTCGYATTRDKKHEFVDGICTGCGLDEGNYEVAQFYVRGTINSWGSPDEYALVYDPKTKTASIQVTLPADAQFKVADANWSDGFNFGFNNITFEAGLFDNNDSDNIHVITAADYIVTVSGFDTGEYSVEVKIACLHEFGPKTLVAGQTCKYTETCSKCQAVNHITEHTFTNDDIICDACGYADLKVYYVKGSFNNFEANEEFTLEYDETTHTATVDLWLQVGHSFKVGTANGWEFGYDEVTFTADANDAFIPDNDRNIYCVAKGEDVIGVKFTVTITGLNTLTHTMTIDTEEEYTVESVILPTSTSGLFILGTMNGWNATDSYGLSKKDGLSVITLTLNAGDEFKVAKSDWSSEFNVNNTTFESGLFTAGGEYGNNLVVVTSGVYTIVVSGSTCTIVAGEDIGDLPTVEPVDQNALYLAGDHNGWTKNNDSKLVAEGNSLVATAEFAVGNEFKVANIDWSKEYNFNNSTFEAGLFTEGGAYGGNFVVTISGLYKVTVTNNVCTIVLVEAGEVTPNPQPTPTVDYYVRGSFAGTDWPALDANKFTVVNDELTVTVTLAVNDEFKIASADWSKEFNYNNITAANGLFGPCGDDQSKPNIQVLHAGTYKFVISGNGVVISLVEETDEPTQGGDEPTQPEPQPTPTVDYYVRGSFAGTDWPALDANKFTVVNDELTVTVTLAVNDEFKIASADWSKEFNYNNITAANGLFGPCGDDQSKPNIQVLQAGTYKFVISDNVVVITLVEETDEPTQGGNEPTQPDEPTQGDETPVDLPEYRLVGSFTSWGFDDDSYKLVAKNGAIEVKVQLFVNDEFKVAVAGWTPELNYKNMTVDSSKIAALDDSEKPNAKVLVDGIYLIKVSGTTASHTCTIEYVGPITCLSNDGNHVLVNANCTEPKHCSVTGCRYTEGEALGHTWNQGTQETGKIVYTCTVAGCNATKEEITDIEQVEGIILYLKPNSNWTQADARFAVYTWGGSEGEKWYDMTDTNGDGIYEVVLPEGTVNVIFCRMNPSTTTNNWNNKWNQTSDLKVQANGNNMYTIQNGSWDAGSWSTK